MVARQPDGTRLGVGLVGEHPADRFRSLVRLVEACGYDDLWVADERFHRDVYCNLTVAALESERLRLGTCVTDPYVRHPALTAVALATIDEISGGRAALGMGAGISGFSAMGIERKKPPVAIREAAAVLRGLWRGERVDLDGEIIRANGAQLNFASRADIPIHVAGRGPAVLATAGEVGDGAIIGTFASKPGISYALRQIERGASRAGRDPAAVRKTSWLYVSVCDDDPGRAKAAVKHGIAVALWGSRPILEKIGIELPAGLGELMGRVQYNLNEEVVGEAARRIPDDYVPNLAVARSSDEVAAQIARIIDLGVDDVAIWPFPAAGQDLEELIEVFAREVMPRVRFHRRDEPQAAGHPQNDEHRVTGGGP